MGGGGRIILATISTLQFSMDRPTRVVMNVEPRNPPVAIEQRDQPGSRLIMLTCELEVAIPILSNLLVDPRSSSLQVRQEGQVPRYKSRQW